jgi:hypothetical protein
MAAVDSGATHNFFPENYNDTAPNSEGPKISVLCANKSTMTSTATDALALTKLPPAARKCYKFPNKSIATPLMSVRKLDKANLQTTFENDQVNVTNKHGAVILHGIADPHTGLYMVHTSDEQPIPLPSTTSTLPRSIHTTHTAANAYNIKAVPALINYYHATGHSQHHAPIANQPSHFSLHPGERNL